MRWLQRWWRQADHYDWLMGYVKFRGLSGLVRTMIAGVAILTSLIPIALMTIPEGPVGAVPRWVTRAAAVGLLFAGLIWVVGLPSRRRSTVFAMGITTCIAAIALSCSDPGVAILVCTTFGVPAAYVAFTHTAIHAAYNFQVAMVVATVEAARLAASGRPVLAACAIWLVFILTVTVPASIQIVVHALGTDLIRADCDPLTFLLNRRGFGIKSQELIHRDRGTDAHLMVTVIDLDGFKTLNDSRGHLFGDRALIAVAEILRNQTPHGAVIGRSGGDEFLIADTTHRPQQSSAAERLRTAIAATPYAITASVGVATVSLSDVDDSAAATIIDDLVMAADLEMYAAKRSGGNRSKHADGQTAVGLAE
ncbi:diguanylate cyclase [Mycolicibacterium sp. CBMA 226]|uniref:GGDEF domain-containing protein n=1 Tax=Mycolicibacterium sp. CBMA 226 TaxID=2606611 RepID=UPI0012DDB4E4|nr:GGDEF domain-containing protein [Mycolicibacterium sp. CBMA 226]MUL78495.1 GGDEF domain-containing protein [Mycolicibacterium sp. CBMA 226]